jgi:hypothetical protein
MNSKSAKPKTPSGQNLLKAFTTKDTKVHEVNLRTGTAANYELPDIRLRSRDGEKRAQ